jgi:hypothetical protein
MMGRAGCFLCLFTGMAFAAPDIRSVKPDLALPPLSDTQPAAGVRVKQTHSQWAKTSVYHTLYLPKDWRPGKTYPVLIEYAGNGPYQNPFGDVSTGKPEGSKMGFGISGGEGFIWVCLPFLDNTGKKNVSRWWGNSPQHDARPTVDYCKKTVPWICKQYGGDPKRVVLCGFSRGAIACNYIGLHDDAIAKLWRAFIPYAHYDGVHERWGYPGADRAAAKKRLRRLGNRPQFICQEKTTGRTSLAATRAYLKTTGFSGSFTFQSTGFRNHNDAWLLRPNPARAALRQWLKMTLAN